MRIAKKKKLPWKKFSTSPVPAGTKWRTNNMDEETTKKFNDLLVRLAAKEDEVARLRARLQEIRTLLVKLFHWKE